MIKSFYVHTHYDLWNFIHTWIYQSKIYSWLWMAVSRNKNISSFQAEGGKCVQTCIGVITKKHEFYQRDYPRPISFLVVHWSLGSPLDEMQHILDVSNIVFNRILFGQRRMCFWTLWPVTLSLQQRLLTKDIRIATKNYMVPNKSLKRSMMSPAVKHTTPFSSCSLSSSMLVLQKPVSFYHSDVPGPKSCLSSIVTWNHQPSGRVFAQGTTVKHSLSTQLNPQSQLHPKAQLMFIKHLS